MSAQHENVNITVYRLPERPRIGELALAKMTHLYLPREFYDEVILEENAVFARKNGVFAAVLANGPLTYRPYDPDAIAGLFRNLRAELPPEYVPQGSFDLCRFGGAYHAYITELSDEDAESFAAFIARIKKNRAAFTGGSVRYETACGVLDVAFDGSFAVNGVPVKTEFDRYDCRFCRAPRKADRITVDSGRHTLELRLKDERPSER